jgi:hypothetical protein
MAGIDYLSEIRRTVGPDEYPDDVVAMIDILAQARTFGRMLIEEREYQFAATVFCVILRPLKPPQYRSDIVRIRRGFIGIARDPNLQILLRDSFTSVLLRTRDERAAIALGVDALFRPLNRFA